MAILSTSGLWRWPHGSCGVLSLRTFAKRSDFPIYDLALGFRVAAQMRGLGFVVSASTLNHDTLKPNSPHAV